MFYTLYKITSKIDNKIYIGVHQTEDLNDGYMGSGARIINAIKKYGKENFEKEILYFFDDQESALIKEREIVNEDFIKDPNTMNIVLGGGMPPSQKGRPLSKTKVGLKGDNRTEKQKEASRRHSEALKGNTPWNKGKKGVGTKKIKTPDGIFESGLAACEYYGLTSGTITHRCKNNLYGFEYYNDKSDKEK